jgi:hypothetical protein
LKFQKLISVLLHPIVIPTIGVLLFLIISPEPILRERKYLLISIVFFSTYIVPLIVLLILKALGFINSLKAETIQERKIPLFLMLVIFYILGKFLYQIPDFVELGMLFYGTNLALIIIYFLFFINVKTSLHVLSISSALAFILFFGNQQSITVVPIVMVLFLLTGILASARLHLKAHTKLEVYLGFVLGIGCQFTVFYLL